MKLNSGWVWTGTGTGARTGTVAAGAEVVAAASTVGAAAVIHPTDLIDGDTAKASAPQGQPPTAGVIPSHDHCSHTCITVTVEQEGSRKLGLGRKLGEKAAFSNHDQSFPQMLLTSEPKQGYIKYHQT